MRRSNKEAGDSPKGVKKGGKTQRQRTQKAGRRPNQQKTKNSKYTLSYNSTNNTTNKRTKQQRLSHGDIPTNKIHNGKTSTIFGHSVEPINNRETFRALFQNPNGINPSEGNYQFLFSLTECYNNCVSLLGLAETNREWKHAHQQRQLREAMHKVWTSSVIQTSTTIDTCEDNSNPGGGAYRNC